jgi:hypothetical protein
VGSRTGLDDLEERRISFHCRNLNLRLFSEYLSHYMEYVVPSTKKEQEIKNSAVDKQSKLRDRQSRIELF